MLGRWLRGRPKYTRQDRSFTMIRATMQRRFVIRTATASSSFSRAGSMRTEADHPGDLRPVADALIAATNTSDVETALALFAPDAVIDDPSTGDRFDGQAGVRDYIERFFVGYRTITRLLSLASTGEHQAR